MNRRGFLKFLGVGIPAAIVAPTYFFAPGSGWHTTAGGLSVASEPILLPLFLTKDALRILKENLQFFPNHTFDATFPISGEKIGNTIHIRKPLRFTA